jgi:predicted DNA-binding transcriptional regulator AlpA
MPSILTTSVAHAVPAPNVTPRVLNTSEAAAYCRSAKSTFDKLRLTGGRPRYIKLGRRVVYDPADLDTWLASNRRTSTSEVRHHG